MTEAETLDRLHALRSQLMLYGADCLQVRDKAGNVVPFVLNNAQLVAHNALEAQKAATGWVRALILKGRQQGISTYVAARYYHRASLRGGVNVFILSHEQGSADTLFGIVDRYQRNNPLHPHVGASNAKELVFDLLDSSYAVATAGSKAVGRGKAILLFHGSEVAFWLNAPDHFSASVQGVPLCAGSEVILESTSAGASGEFYERWQDAIAGRGDYIAIFLPWWLSPEYARPPPPDFELSAEEVGEGEMTEVEYAETYGLSLEQMAWRRSKMIELRDPSLFAREYPATPAEAWTAPAGHEPYILPLIVQRARRRRTEAAGPLIIGVDPASGGGDRFAISARRGYRVLWTKYRNKIDTLMGTAWVKSIIDEFHPARVNIDAGNIGAAIITNLRATGPEYVKVVRGINFGGTSEAKLAKPKTPGPKNRRTEMWMRYKDWLVSPEGAQLPDDAALESDTCGPKMLPSTNNDQMLESKKELRKRGIRSSDLADSVVLTFASNETLTGYYDPGEAPQFGLPDAPRHVTTPHESYIPPAGPQGWMC